jgi:hypothetical protein
LQRHEYIVVASFKRVQLQTLQPMNAAEEFFIKLSDRVDILKIPYIIIFLKIKEGRYD